MKKIILSITVLFIVFTQQSNAQVTFQLGGGAGYAIASSDLGGDINLMDDSGYGMDGGFNIHVKARVGLLSFIAVGEIGYTMMSSEGSVGSVKYDNSLNVFSIKVGPEFHISLPLIPIDPYIGANLQLNSFSGDTEFEGMPGIASGTYDLESATRTGIGINGGVVFSLAGLKLDLNIGYNMLNAFGKDYEDNPAADKLYLDDGEGGGSEASSLNTIEIKATLMFGL